MEREKEGERKGGRDVHILAHGSRLEVLFVLT
jgi:hypothetical protein